MPNATRVRDADKFQLLASATYAGGALIQLPTGEPAFLDQTDPLASAKYSDAFRSGDKATVEKQTGVVMLAGQEAYWDRSAAKLTYNKVNDRDFCAGVIVSDAATADITANLDIGKRQRFDIDFARDFFLTSVTGTQALNTMGLFHRGGGAKLILSSTAEVQKVDALSRDGFAPGAKWIAEFLFTIPNGGAGAAPDFNIGVASGTHATDADAIAEHAFIHIDGNATAIKAQSKDGTTTVAATDTTLTYTAGSAVANRVHVLIDGRDLTSVKFYVNGARVLSATTFRLDNAVGPLFLLAHLEKTSAADVFEVDMERARVWFSEQ